MKEKKTYVLSIGMSKEQYYTLVTMAKESGTSASKLMYDKLDLDNLPLLPLPEGAVLERPRKKQESTTEAIV